MEFCEANLERIEVWKSVVGYEGVYEVSDLGNVRRVGKSKLMKLHLQKGYPHFVASKNNQKKKIAVHRWVAGAFCHKPKGCNFVNHINGVRSDNRSSNLEWVTPSQNELHSIRVLGKKQINVNGNKFQSFLSKAQYLEIRALEGLFSHDVLAAANSVSTSTISSLLRGQTYKQWLSEELPMLPKETIARYEDVRKIVPSSIESIRLPRPKDLEGELWKDVVGFEGRYQISNYGRVLSLRRNEMLTESDNFGYRRVFLYDGTRLRSKVVHRLLMEAFCPIFSDVKMVVNHKDGNRSNNDLRNLEWCTYQENNIHAYQQLNKGASIPKGEKHSFAKLSAANVRDIRSLAGQLTHEAISQQFGIARPTVTDIINGKTWRHLLD